MADIQWNDSWWKMVTKGPSEFSELWREKKIPKTFAQQTTLIQWSNYYHSAIRVKVLDYRQELDIFPENVWISWST